MKVEVLKRFLSLAGRVTGVGVARIVIYLSGFDGGLGRLHAFIPVATLAAFLLNPLQFRICAFDAS
jgi:hypothetical protein